MPDQPLGGGTLPANCLTRPLAETFSDVHPAWRGWTDEFLRSAAGRSLCAAVDQRRAAGEIVMPDRPLRALADIAPNDVRVVILGQDPYHGPGQAEGLAFSVPSGKPLPPSLRNVFKERLRDLGLPMSNHGHLGSWVRQGVLLLNTSLTVAAGEAGSHARLGWQILIDRVVEAVASDRAPKVFMLWGAHAQAKADLIATAGPHHLRLCANHPSPLSALRPPVPFIGSAPFSQANRWLQSQGMDAIDWAT